jgi:hypothetical protein
MSAYTSLDLRIIALEGSHYQVLVVAGPIPLPDPLPQQVFLPSPEADTLAILAGQAKPPQGVSRNQVAQHFGGLLHQWLLGGAVAEYYTAAREAAIRSNQGLRLRLDLSRAGVLAAWPWEYLRDPHADFIALSRTSPLVRYSPALVNRPLPPLTTPLRILVMISNPSDVTDLDEETERRNLLRATIELQQRGLVEVEFLEDASLRQLQRVLRQKEFHVFHYIGHGVYHPASRQGLLIFEDPFDHTRAQAIRGEALARELHEETSLRLVVLNACQGALSDGFDPFSGVASSLIQRGMPAVVAQQFEITDRAAILFSEEFYKALAEGLPMEAAIAEGRRAILGSLGSRDNIEWATPVLFLSQDAPENLFHFPRRRFDWREERYWPWIAAAMVSCLLLMALTLALGIGRDAHRAQSVAPFTPTAIPNVDLVVKEVRLLPRHPRPGELVAVFVDIQNLGSDPAPTFEYQWQANLFDPTSTVTRRVEGLAAGGILHDSFWVRLGWWGVFISETRLDTTQQLVELSEQNQRAYPIRADASQPFIINFSDPLPDGGYLSGDQPLPAEAFLPWGFRIEAQKPSDPACREIVPWLKFIGISQVALTTGLSSDPTQCSDGDIIITFVERADSNVGGISRLSAFFGPGFGRREVRYFGDRLGENDLGAIVGSVSRTQGLGLTAQPAALTPIYQVRISSPGAAMNLTQLTLYAP